MKLVLACSDLVRAHLGGGVGYEKQHIGSLATNCSAIEGQSFLGGFHCYSTIQFPLGGIPNPKLWLQGCIGEHSSQVVALGCYYQCTKAGHFHQKHPLQGEMGRRKRGLWRSRLLQGAHFTMQLMERL